jgi:hypothetical protein
VKRKRNIRKIVVWRIEEDRGEERREERGERCKRIF